jgi:hypothetical protein
MAEQRTAASVLVATHSPEFLDHPGATTIQVTRSSETGATEYRHMDPADRLDLAAFGLNPSDLLRRQRGLLLVEGRHDEDVLAALMGDTLARLRVEVVAMRGASQLPATIESQVLFDFTDAHVFVMLDNLDADRIEHAWATARAAADADDMAAAVAALGAALSGKVSEERWLREWLTKAIRKGRSSRVTPLGLSRQDIIEYLPVERLVPRKGSWADLRLRHDEARVEGQRHPDFKTWLRQRYSASLSDEDVESAARSMYLIPDEFVALGRTIEAVLRSSNPTAAASPG